MQLFRPGSVSAGPPVTIDLAGTGDLTAAEDLLAAALAWPSAGEHPWTVRANMVGSLDGGATVDGTSGGLGSATDQKLIGLQRDLADVVLVGAGTVIGENYPGTKTYPKRAARRQRWGRSPVPPWAIVASRPLPAGLRAITESRTPTIVITGDGVEQPAGTEVIRTGPAVDLRSALAALADRGHHRILCEGGPQLLGRLAAGDLLDELSLTISPTLLGAGSSIPLLGGIDLAGQRSDDQPDGRPARWRLVTLLAAGDHLFTRYQRQR